MCEQQYFFDYVLGYKGPSNKKADKGTIVHKALEILAFIKYNQQNDNDYFEDDVIGEVDVNNYSLPQIINDVYDFYTSQFKHHEWSEKDRKDCTNWTYKAIEYADGMFDPRNRDILYPEQQFDIKIDKPWAKYNYGDLKGELRMKGTIDLITKVNDNTLEIIDWKTGRRLNWATGEEKTQIKLETDPQLMIYFYAVQKLYPEIKNCIVTIFFINDGGPFSMTFGSEDIYKTEQLLRQKFEDIKRCNKPKLNKSWKCKKLCHYGKNSFDGTNITPLIEYRQNQNSDEGEFMTMCEQVKHDIEMYGINNVVDTYTVPGYNVGYYKAPGSTE